MPISSFGICEVEDEDVTVVEEEVDVTVEIGRLDVGVDEGLTVTNLKFDEVVERRVVDVEEEEVEIVVVEVETTVVDDTVL